MIKATTLSVYVLNNVEPVCDMPAVLTFLLEFLLNVATTETKTTQCCTSSIHTHFYYM